MFFHYTATTEIYTYGHSLSLHDARPILVAGASAGIFPPVTRPVPAAACVTNAYTAPAPCPRSGGFVMWSARRTISSLPDRRYVDAYDPCASCARSEEHTSELQSLMRISYAVFCLKKKKTRHSQVP